MKTFFLKFAAVSITFFHVVFAAGFNSNSWYTTRKGLRYYIDIQYKWNWFQASRECTVLDLQLAVIDTEEKNADLVQLLKTKFAFSRSLWLGAHDEYNPAKDTKRPFYWRATGEPLKYSNWFGNNPDNEGGKEHCIQTWEYAGNFEWNDNECDTFKGGYICEENNRTCNQNSTAIVYKD